MEARGLGGTGVPEHCRHPWAKHTPERQRTRWAPAQGCLRSGGSVVRRYVGPPTGLRRPSAPASLCQAASAGWLPNSAPAPEPHEAPQRPPRKGSVGWWEQGAGVGWLALPHCCPYSGGSPTPLCFLPALCPGCKTDVRRKDTH